MRIVSLNVSSHRESKQTALVNICILIGELGYAHPRLSCPTENKEQVRMPMLSPAVCEQADLLLYISRRPLR
jgi:hypothetical protein